MSCIMKYKSIDDINIDDINIIQGEIDKDIEKREMSINTILRTVYMLTCNDNTLPILNIDSLFDDIITSCDNVKNNMGELILLTKIYASNMYNDVSKAMFLITQYNLRLSAIEHVLTYLLHIKDYVVLNELLVYVFEYNNNMEKIKDEEYRNFLENKKYIIQEKHITLSQEILDKILLDTNNDEITNICNNINNFQPTSFLQISVIQHAIDMNFCQTKFNNKIKKKSELENIYSNWNSFKIMLCQQEFSIVVDMANVSYYDEYNYQKFTLFISSISSISNNQDKKILVIMPMGLYKNKKYILRNPNIITYVTPYDVNDDWYWLYASVTLKIPIITNDDCSDIKCNMGFMSEVQKWIKCYGLKTCMDYKLK